MTRDQERHGGRIALALAVLAIGSCDLGSDVEGRTFSVKDSAGIQVVTSHAPRWSEGEVWQVSSEPTLKIGSVEGPPELTFGTVRSVGWLSDGRIFVGDEQAHTIRMFAPDGAFLDEIGGEGRGPGELQWFLKVAPYRRDSLFVYDYAQSAASVFSPENAFVRRFQNPISQGNYWIVDALMDGRFLIASPGDNTRGEGPGFVSDTSRIIVASPDGSEVDTVGAFEARIRFLGPDGRDEPLYLAPVGTVLGAGDHLIWLEGQTFEYTEASAKGTVQRIVRKAHETVPVTAEMIDEFKRHYLAEIGSNYHGGEANLRQALEEGEYYPNLPAASYYAKMDALGYVCNSSRGNYHVREDVADGAWAC